jgi:hypothetical protein
MPNASRCRTVARTALHLWTLEGQNLTLPLKVVIGRRREFSEQHRTWSPVSIIVVSNDPSNLL